jgi:endonuclease/exonuclease/phosphatase family metal-dependent hydrolase
VPGSTTAIASPVKLPEIVMPADCENLSKKSTEPEREKPLTLASYNIRRCVGSDGQQDAARIREVLQMLDADVIALQEVEVSPLAPDLLEYFCEQGDWRPILGITLRRASGDYGNAVLSRFPIRAVHRQDLSYRHREPRGALHLDLECGGSPLRVVATHFGLRPIERRAQAEALADELDAFSRSSTAPSATVLMGDFNEWYLWGRTLRHLSRRFLPSPSPRTFPARQPLFALDRIWVSKGVHAFRLEAVRTPLTRVASDHLPLRASLRL